MLTKVFLASAVSASAFVASSPLADVADLVNHVGYASAGE